ncbi:hypothetical protein [Amycolatopsis anabasis]|uniref:hypothetical protein n=1 Tax=Amycolatopsis anabasis TaxID=1840409 RepID=UPI001FE6C969|nr:hypothetical protein [Amycolatopsis anabasis]
MSGYLELAASMTLYGLGIVAQSAAACRVGERSRSRIGFLSRLLADKVYLFGFTSQIGAFGLAFLARASLPLYLVQAGSCAAIGVGALLGALVLRWRIRPAELAALAIIAAGLVLLAGASTVSVARDIPPGFAVALFGTVAAGAVVLIPVSRVNAGLASAVLAGVAFGVVAVVSRTLADEPLAGLLFSPLTWLMVLAAVVGQSGLALALKSGPATSVVASMDATSVVLASVAGMTVLGDQIVPGRQWSVASGLSLVLAGVLVLGSCRQTPVVDGVRAHGTA